MSWFKEIFLQVNEAIKQVNYTYALKGNLFFPGIL